MTAVPSSSFQDYGAGSIGERAQGWGQLRREGQRINDFVVFK